MTDRARTILIGVVVPAVVALAGVAMIIVALPQLPDPVAIHWGPSGEADGFGPAWITLVLLVLLVGGFSAFILVGLRGEQRFAPPRRVVVATAPFLAVLLTVVTAGSLWMQRGLADAAQAPSVVPLIVGGILGGLAVAAASWFVLPASDPVDQAAEELPVLELGATERAAWMRRVTPSGLVTGLVLGTLALVTLVSAVALASSAPPLVAALYGGILVLVIILVAATLFWRVRVSEAGLLVRSALGVPRFRVPLEDVDSALAIQVNPVGDFGGWGIRWGGPGRLGVVTRRGEALEVRRRAGRSLVVTVDDAEKAAALLNALVARRGTMA